MTMPAINYVEWCCADPAVGGCPHRYLDDHDRNTGACTVVGCPCLQPRDHMMEETADGPA
jgi:hypothetical protein